MIEKMTIIMSRQAHQDMMDERAAMMHLVRVVLEAPVPFIARSDLALAERVLEGKGAFGWRWFLRHHNKG